MGKRQLSSSFYRSATHPKSTISNKAISNEPTSKNIGDPPQQPAQSTLVMGRKEKYHAVVNGAMSGVYSLAADANRVMHGASRLGKSDNDLFLMMKTFVKRQDAENWVRHKLVENEIVTNMRTFRDLRVVAVVNGSLSGVYRRADQADRAIGHIWATQHLVSYDREQAVNWLRQRLSDAVDSAQLKLRKTQAWKKLEEISTALQKLPGTNWIPANFSRIIEDKVSVRDEPEQSNLNLSRHASAPASDSGPDFFSFNTPLSAQNYDKISASPLLSDLPDSDLFFFDTTPASASRTSDYVFGTESPATTPAASSSDGTSGATLKN